MIIICLILLGVLIEDIKNSHEIKEECGGAKSTEEVFESRVIDGADKDPLHPTEEAGTSLVGKNRY